MREVKFRVYDQTSKDYTVYGIGEAVDEHFGLGIISRIVWWLKDIKHKFITEQYTGLKDKNDKEIYEGDIISCYSLSGEYGALFVVKYGELPDICGHEYCPCLQGFYLDEIDEYEEVDEDGYMEVIGNIHDNPELLGDEDE